MMSRLYDVLVAKFGFSRLPGEDVFYRRWEQEVEVAWWGKQTSVYEVFVHVMDDPEVTLVVYCKNGERVKQKYYSSGPARTLRAIEDTVKFEGFVWEVA